MVKLPVYGMNCKYDMGLRCVALLILKDMAAAYALQASRGYLLSCLARRLLGDAGKLPSMTYIGLPVYAVRPRI